jgi:hypothetical protein
MKYATPELVLLGSASALVRGDEPGQWDNIVSDETLPGAGIALGLDE